MSKKMAVKNKGSKEERVKLQIPFWSDTTKPSLRGGFTIAVLSIAFIVGVFSYDRVKQAVVEQWKVTEVSINQNLKYIKPNKIARILSKDKYSYLLQVDVDSLQKEIELLNWIKHANIRKKWPNTLEVILEEHKPIAFVNDSVLLDSGKIVEENNIEKAVSLPQLILDEEELWNVLEHELNSDLLASQYLKIVNEYNEIQQHLNFVGIEVDSLDINKNLSWTFYSSTQLTINVGRKKRISRIETLRNLVPRIEKFDEVKTIDLRYSNGVAISRNKLKDDQYEQAEKQSNKS